MNLVSLFAFIVVLGLVVDDAIVTGENVYPHLRHGTDPLAPRHYSIGFQSNCVLPVTICLSMQTERLS